MKKLHIMVDCDDVLNNLTEDWVGFLNKKHGLSVNPINKNRDELYRAFPTLTREEIKSPLRDPAFSGTYTVKPYSYEYLKKMVDDGHEVSIVTAHNNRTAGAKFDWVVENFPFLSRSDVIITEKKQKIIGDVLIDDAVKNLVGGNYFKILFHSPNNRGYDAEANGMVRVYTLKEAYEIIVKYLY